MRRAASVLVVFSAALAPSVVAQVIELASSDRAPRFLYASSARATPVPVEPRNIPMLGRRVTLRLDSVPLRAALDAISQQSGLRLFYSKDLLPLDQVISIKSEDLTVAAVLTEVLFDTDVDVLLGPSNQAALVRRGAGLQVGSLTGRATDAKTQQGVAGVRVFLDGTRWGTTTDSAGGYRLSEVTPGPYTLMARRIGYKPYRQPVTVEPGQEVTVNVALETAPSELEAVVVTATGEQRLLELGHVVGRINADSIVREAPVSNLSDVLTARVPGLQVFQNQGTVGGQVDLRIRGPNSLILGPAPIVVVDGVRYTTALRPMGAAATDGTGGVGEISGPALVEPTSPLNDINVNDVESIEVVKGPSAATLYGSDAANGVIVITTKRGRPGPARWNAFAKGTTTAIPTPHFPDIYWGWGTVFGVPNNATASCTLILLAYGACTRQDSITVLPNPLNNQQVSIFGSKPSWESGASVVGGQGDLRYYFSADRQNETGPIQMPPAMAQQLLQQRGLRELPDEWRDPNTSSRLNLRSNVTAVFSHAADLSLSAGYVQSSTRTLSTSFGGPYSVALFSTPTAPYGGGSGAPASSFLQTSTEDVHRFFASATGHWQALFWLEARGTVGLDLTSSSRNSIARRGDAVDLPDGAVGEDDGLQSAVTAELGATATARRGRASLRTAAGVQYVRNATNSLFTYGTNLPPGGTSVQQALTLQSRQTYSADVTLGSYLEETVGLNDRLFLTGALRVDGASTFGQDYTAAAYPKASVSWLVSEEPFMPRLPGLDELRLRYAFGASGRQPGPRWSLPQFYGSTTIVDGVIERTALNSTLGNPNLRPERDQEHEFGLDARGVGGRVSLGLTWFRRRAKDQIINFQLPLGFGTQYRNLGLTTQRGFEAELTARVLDTRRLSLDVRLQHSWNTTDLVDLGNVPASRDFRGGYVQGYPLGARFGFPVIGYRNADGDGILDYGELVYPDTAVYLGQSVPPTSQTLSAVLGLFERRVRLSALAERRAGFTQINTYAQCAFGTCRAAVDPRTPLAAQAQGLNAQNGLDVEKGDFIRLREVSLAVDLPARAARALRVQSAALALSARNLALWTSFSGPDPESAILYLQHEQGALSGNQANGIPLGRSFELRLDLGL